MRSRPIGVLDEPELKVSLSLPPGRTTVIPNPVDLERVRSERSRGADPYADKAGKRFAAVGRLHHQKGFDLLLKAFGKALREVPDLHLTIVGEGPEKRALVKLAQETGISNSLTFAGHRDNPYPFMAHADIVVSSSRWEGSPNVVLEALACKTPVLAFDCPGGTGEIIRDGENGWLIPSLDWRAMGRKMVALAREEDPLPDTDDDLLPVQYHHRHVVERYENLLMGFRS